MLYYMLNCSRIVLKSAVLCKVWALIFSEFQDFSALHFWNCSDFSSEFLQEVEKELKLVLSDAIGLAICY